MAHDCSAQLTNADEWIELRELDVLNQKAPHPAVDIARKPNTRAFDQSIPSSYTTRHIIQNGHHHRGEARWYVAAHSQMSNREHPTDRPD